MIRNNSSGDQNIPQPKSSSAQNAPQHQKATIDIAKRFIEATGLTKNPWPKFSDDKNSTVEETWILKTVAQDHQQAVEGAPVGTPSLCQLPSGPSLNLDLQMREPVSFEFCLKLLYLTYGY